MCIDILEESYESSLFSPQKEFIICIPRLPSITPMRFFINCPLKANRMDKGIMNLFRYQAQVHFKDIFGNKTHDTNRGDSETIITNEASRRNGLGTFTSRFSFLSVARRRVRKVVFGRVAKRHRRKREPKPTTNT